MRTTRREFTPGVVVKRPIPRRGRVVERLPILTSVQLGATNAIASAAIQFKARYALALLQFARHFSGFTDRFFIRAQCLGTQRMVVTIGTAASLTVRITDVVFVALVGAQARGIYRAIQANAVLIVCADSVIVTTVAGAIRRI
jgi:hypothetical protein